MSIFYDQGNAQKSDFDPRLLNRINPNSVWATHSYNHFVLSHIVKSSDDAKERFTALNELEIAEKKMKYWERNPKFDLAHALIIRKRNYRY